MLPSDPGDVWPSLYVTPEVRYYFRKTATADPFDGWYVAFKYRLSSRGVEMEQDNRNGISFGPKLPPARCYYRQTHKLGLVVGMQHGIGQRQRTLIQASGGAGAIFNHNFCYADLALFTDVGLNFVLSRK